MSLTGQAGAPSVLAHKQGAAPHLTVAQQMATDIVAKMPQCPRISVVALLQRAAITCTRNAYSTPPMPHAAAFLPRCKTP